MSKESICPNCGATNISKDLRIENMSLRASAESASAIMEGVLKQNEELKGQKEWREHHYDSLTQENGSLKIDLATAHEIIRQQSLENLQQRNTIDRLERDLP